MGSIPFQKLIEEFGNLRSSNGSASHNINRKSIESLARTSMRLESSKNLYRNTKKAALFSKARTQALKCIHDAIATHNHKYLESMTYAEVLENLRSNLMNNEYESSSKLWKSVEQAIISRDEINRAIISLTATISEISNVRVKLADELLIQALDQRIMLNSEILSEISELKKLVTSQNIKLEHYINEIFKYKMGKAGFNLIP